MVEGEKSPLGFLSKVDKATDKLAILGDGKSEEEVNHRIVQNLSSRLAAVKKPIIFNPGIPRFEINEIIRGAYFDDKMEKDLIQRTMAVQWSVDPLALGVGSVNPAGAGGGDG